MGCKIGPKVEEFEDINGPLCSQRERAVGRDQYIPDFIGPFCNMLITCGIHTQVLRQLLPTSPCADALPGHPALAKAKTVGPAESWILFPLNLIGHYSSFRRPFSILARGGGGQEVPFADFRGTCSSSLASANFACFTGFASSRELAQKGQSVQVSKESHVPPVLVQRRHLPAKQGHPPAELPRSPPAVLVLLAYCWQLLF